ncbi:hypothetical protein Hgul01_01890 [Herpetosiphon gulosus]|uniref:Zinc-finger domain-containing protein n=2 Tax=Herpetosiphon gulosus TaxID=1973496 RepID=A0ABP9WYF8_9CHLR
MNPPLCACSDVQHWLQTKLTTITLAEAYQAFNRHLCECPICRGALYESIRLEWLADHIPSSDCEQCQDLMTDFVTLERHNPLEALQRYPSVWLHLWFCAECLETYTEFVGLLDHEPSLLMPTHWIGPSVAASIAKPSVIERFKPLLTILRSALGGLPTQLELSGAFRNSGAMGYLIRPFGAYTIPPFSGEIHAFAETDGTWTLEVSIEPLRPGSLKAQIGTYSQVCPIPLEGPAVFVAIPQDQLMSPETDLKLSIELADLP